jgi:hypothetical protein
MTDVINWVGVGTGLVGALVVAPSGAVELVRQVAAGARHVLPRKGGECVIVPPHMAGASAAAGTPSIYTGISQDAPMEDKVLQLVRAVDKLNEDLARMRQEVSREDGRLRLEIGQPGDPAANSRGRSPGCQVQRSRAASHRSEHPDDRPGEHPG